MTYKRPLIMEAVVLATETESQPIHIGDYLLAGIQTPSALTSTELQFEVRARNDLDFVPLVDVAGTPIEIAVAPDQAIGLSGVAAEALAPWPWVRIVLGSAEAADRTLYLSLK